MLYIDSAKTSTLEGAGTSVYAQGGRGNARLVTWEGEKTLTFTVEDALLSPLGFSILSGAGLLDSGTAKVHVHKMVSQIVEEVTTTYSYYELQESEGTYTYVSISNLPVGRTAETVGEVPTTDLSASSYPYIKIAVSHSYKVNVEDALDPNEEICATAPIFIIVTEDDGSLTGTKISPVSVGSDGKSFTFTDDTGAYTNKTIVVAADFYVVKEQSNAIELQIDAENFAGYYYVEADTLFRRQDNGKDMPAIITLPNVKIQSNFTFTMASSGDPSTFTFTMDAMPGYTYFDKTKKVLCVIQIIQEDVADKKWKTVMGHTDGETQETFVESKEDSYPFPS